MKTKEERTAIIRACVVQQTRESLHDCCTCYLAGELTSGQYLYQLHQGLTGATEETLRLVAEFLEAVTRAE